MYFTQLQEILRYRLSKSQVFWNTTRCELVNARSYRRFERSQCLTHMDCMFLVNEGITVLLSVRDFVTVGITEDLNVEQYGCDNLIA